MPKVTSKPTSFLTQVFDTCPETNERQKLAYVGEDEKNEAMVIMTRGKTTAWKHTIRTEEIDLGEIPAE